jgi:hypothetical protein
MYFISFYTLYFIRIFQYSSCTFAFVLGSNSILAVVKHESSSYGSTAQFDPRPPLLGFLDNNLFYRTELLVQRTSLNLEEKVSVFMTPGDRVAQLYPQALGTHFSRLLRHAWFTVGLFFNPGHHTGTRHE